MHQDHLLDSNPAAKATKWLVPGRRKSHIDVFTAPELKHLLRRAQNHGPMTHAMVALLVFTCMRISEVMGLRLDDLNFDRREIQVRRAWGNISRGPQYFGPPKGKERIVDMSEKLCGMLRLWATGHAGGWLFPGPGGVPITPNNFYSSHWRKLFDHPAVAYRHPHVLRHTYAAHLLWQGESPHYVMSQLGQSSIKITVDLYGHWIRTDNKRAVDQRDDAIDSAASLRKSDASNARQTLRIVK